jgi:hypothetical protein
MNAVLQTQVCQGTVTTRSVLQAVAVTRPYTGAVQLGAADLADTTLCVVLTLQASLEPGWWRPMATLEWQGGVGAAPPTVLWTGLARRVRLVLDLSRPVSVGASIA